MLFPPRTLVRRWWDPHRWSCELTSASEPKSICSIYRTSFLLNLQLGNQRSQNRATKVAGGTGRLNPSRLRKEIGDFSRLSSAIEEFSSKRHVVHAGKDRP